MIQAEIHDIPLDIHDHEHENIKDVVKSWEQHKTDFKEMRDAVDKDPNRKVYIGNVVFEKKDGKYILRKSNSVH